MVKILSVVASLTGAALADSIAGVAEKATELSTLVAALEAADLVSAVDGEGSLTVFAPTNDAFGQLDNKTLDCLLEPVGKSALADVLKLHVVPKEANSHHLFHGEKLPTLKGDHLFIKRTQGFFHGDVLVEASNEAKVIAADIEADNGVVHEVDAVLIPESFKAPQCGSGTIAATASATKGLSTLVAALGAADLVDAFNGKDVLTVFAPTNEAFAKLGDAVQCLLKPENVEALKTVLTYHVVPDYALASDIKEGLELATLEKEKLTFSTEDGVSLQTTGGTTAKVTAANVFATNGVVHVIDSVLLPKGFLDSNPCGSDSVAVEADKTIAKIAEGAKELSTLVAALTATDLVAAVDGTDKLTVFAPTNDAFAKLDSTTLNCLLQPVGIPTLADVLKLHVVPKEAESHFLFHGERLPTLEGARLRVRRTQGLLGGDVLIDASNEVKVIAADIKASNGVAHEVDSVLIPATFVAPQCGSGTIAATASTTKDLSTLVAALSAAQLVDTFNGKAVFTVFAPTNEAFAALGDVATCLMKPENVDALTTILTYHVVADYALASDITEGLALSTLEKENLTFSTKSGVQLKTTGGNAATLVAANVFATNGVVHIIDSVLLPKNFVESNPCASSMVQV